MADWLGELITRSINLWVVQLVCGGIERVEKTLCLNCSVFNSFEQSALGSKCQASLQLRCCASSLLL